jgi:hypothetical protein
MELVISLVIGLLLGGGLVALVFAARVKESREALAQRETELAALRDEKSALAVRCATLQSELESERALFAERQATLEAARAGFADAFKAISADALAKNNQSFLELARAALEAQQATAGRTGKAPAGHRRAGRAGEDLAGKIRAADHRPGKGPRRCLCHAFRTGARAGDGPGTVAPRDRQPGQGPARAADARPLGRAATQARGRDGRHARPLRFLRTGKREHRGRPPASRPDRQAARRQAHRGRRQGAARRLPRSPRSAGRGGQEAQARRPRAPGARPPEEARAEILLGAVPALAGFRRAVPARRDVLLGRAGSRPLADRAGVERA